MTENSIQTRILRRIDQTRGEMQPDPVFCRFSYREIRTLAEILTEMPAGYTRPALRPE